MALQSIVYLIYTAQRGLSNVASQPKGQDSRPSYHLSPSTLLCCSWEQQVEDEYLLASLP